MKRPAELDDWDRKPNVVAQYRAVIDAKHQPFGASKRIPSPYTNVEPPRVVKRDFAAPVAFLCFASISAMLTIIGAVQIGRWLVEAVR